MAQVFPTKSNLMSTKKSLDLAKLGYDLLDRKRNILVHEMMQLIDKASKIQRDIDETYSKAYLALQRANVTLGMCGIGALLRFLYRVGKAIDAVLYLRKLCGHTLDLREAQICFVKLGVGRVARR